MPNNLPRRRWVVLIFLLIAVGVVLFALIRRTPSRLQPATPREVSEPTPSDQTPHLPLPTATQPQQHPRGPWKPTTVPYDPTCAQGCKEIGWFKPGHIGEEILLQANPNVDDPIAQWSTCLDEVMTCLEGGGVVLACAETAPTCPDLCKQEFAARATHLSVESQRLATFESVFVQPGSPCRPNDPGGVP